MVQLKYRDVHVEITQTFSRGVSSYRMAQDKDRDSALLQEYMDMFEDTESYNAFNMLLVLRGVRPGMRAECYDTLKKLDEEHGLGRTAGLARKYVNAHAPEECAKRPWPKHVLRVNELTYDALRVEYMHLILARLRSVAGPGFVVEPSGCEVYVVKKTSQKYLDAVLLARHDDENLRVYQSLARVFGYPVLSSIDQSGKNEESTVHVHVKLADGELAPHRPDFRISLYQFAYEFPDQLREQQRRAHRARKTLVGLEYRWRGARFVVTDVVLSP